MRRVLIGGALVGLLSSCMISMSKEEQVQNILSAPSVTASEEGALTEPFFTRGAWPTENWWEVYESAELNGLIAQALENNPTVQAVGSRIAVARNQAVIARSKLFPLVFFDASDEWEYLSKNGFYRALNDTIHLNNQQIDLSLSFFYEFDFWGKYRNLYAAAVGRQKAQEAEEAEAKLIVATAVAQAYFAYVTNGVRKRLYQEIYRVRKNEWELQKALMKHALVSDLPPLQSQEAVWEAEQWLAGIEEALAVNCHVINALAGRGPDEPVVLQVTLPTLPRALVLPEHLAAELLARRPDLMAQIWRLDALAADVGAAKADFWPNVNLTGLLGLQSGAWSDLFQWASKTVGATPALSLPVFTAGAIGANVGEKKALFDEAAYQYNDLILKSFQEVADLLAMGLSIYRQKEEQEEILTNAQKRYELTSLRKERGIDNALQVDRFLEEVLQKQLKDVELLYQQYLVSIRLTKALGGGYDGR